MTAPNFGMTFSRPRTEPVPTSGADFGQSLLIETSGNADATKFPIGEPVRISTSDPEALAKLGTGPLRDAVAGINAQLSDGSGNLNVGADATIFRVAEGANVAATAANIVAALGQVEYIADEVDATPRLVWAGRTAYRPDPDAAGPVVAALPEALEKLLAIAPVDVNDTTRAGAVADRETMTSQRLMPIGVAARVYEGENLVTRPMGPRVLGLFIRVDNENQGKPFDPIANRRINVAGVSRKLRFSFLDGSTEGQQLLDAQVSIVVKGKVNVDGAVASGGFTFIGADNAETGELWQQIHQVRGTDYITVKLIDIYRQFLGGKIEVDSAESVINSIRFMLRDHKKDGDILGYDRDVFIPDQNSPEKIRLGRFKLDLGIEPVPMFRRFDTEIRRYRPAVELLVSDIVARLNRIA